MKMKFITVQKKIETHYFKTENIRTIVSKEFMFNVFYNVSRNNFAFFVLNCQHLCCPVLFITYALKSERCEKIKALISAN